MLGPPTNDGIEIPGVLSMTTPLKSERMIWRISQVASVIINSECATSLIVSEIESPSHDVRIDSVDKTTAIATWCNLWKKSESNKP